jgi:ketosteroid isomerase-like protein
MTNRNQELVRQAYQAYTRGDLDGLLDLVDPDLEWTYLDPEFADPRPATCHGRDQLRAALQRQASHGLPTELEEVVASGDSVLVVIHQPGLDRLRFRQGNDRNYLVLTLDQGRIIKMRTCQDRAEARARAGLNQDS